MLSKCSSILVISEYIDYQIFIFRLTDVQKKEKGKPKPLALNTVEMLRVASSGLGKSCVINRDILHPALINWSLQSAQ